MTSKKNKLVSSPVSISLPPLIQETSQLIEICGQLEQETFIAVDTEFMRESTYYPKLCLIQIASSSSYHLIDPLSEHIDLSPFFELMKNPNLIKVFHSARQDLEIIWNLGHLIPFPLFDSQVAAMICGFGDSISYEHLVMHYLNKKIDKSSRFTDWSLRPLTDSQSQYALSDVIHLAQVYPLMKFQIDEKNRESWIQDEMDILLSPSTYEQKPEDMWKKFIGRIHKAKDIAVMMEVAAWRELEAQKADVPRRRILKDEALTEVALAAPCNEGALGRLRAVPNGFERSKLGHSLLEAVKKGINKPPEEIPTSSFKRQHVNEKVSALVELFKVLLKEVSDREGVAMKIIAHVDDLKDLARDESSTNPLLSGWRRDLFGENALALKSGKLGLAVKKGKVTVVPIE